MASRIYYLDPNDILPPVITPLPLPPGALFVHTTFDPCTQVFYGILNAYADSVVVARYDPVAQVFTTLHAFPLPQYVQTQPWGEFDATSQVYTVVADQGLFGINVQTSQVLYNTPFVNIPNESFGHMALLCNSLTETPAFYGTSVDMDITVKCLSTIDAYTGVIAHVSGNWTTSGVWKPYTGGSCIDQNTATFYWSGAGGKIVGASTTTGMIVHDQYGIGAGELHFIEHFSSCACLATNVAPTRPEAWSVTSSDDGSSLVVTLDTDHQMGTRFLVFDAVGRTIRSQEISSAHTIIDISALPAGCYLYASAGVSGGRGRLSGKFVKR